MSLTESEVSLLGRIGGVPGVTRLVDKFYACVLNDPTLRPYFEGVELHKLQCMQSEFFLAALGGQTTCSDRTVHHAHQGLKITPEHFQAFVGHLFETLKGYAITDDERYALIARINTYADDVFDSRSAPTE
jgi:hemoglobin